MYKEYKIGFKSLWFYIFLETLFFMKGKRSTLC